jgi:muconolactone D-isomerase
MRFLLDIEVRIPHTLALEEVEALVERERERGRELVEAGTIEHIWRVPAAMRNVSIWHAVDATDLHTQVTSLPLYRYATISVIPLADHPLMGGPADG